MNYYDTEEYKNRIHLLEDQVFSKISFENIDRVIKLTSGYTIKCFRFIDKEGSKPGFAPVDGEICRLYHNDIMVFEWKHIDGCTRFSKIIDHSDGRQYLVFDEELYGYSVLDLNSFECMHYLPKESYLEYPGGFEETFIWCDCHYNDSTNQLAVEGCFWGAPYSVAIIDFANPMVAVEAKDWIDIYDECYKCDPTIAHIDFVKWDGPILICRSDGFVDMSLAVNGKYTVKVYKDQVDSN